MAIAIVQIPIDMDVLHRAETAERETGRTLSDALREYIERLADDDEGDITFVAHTPAEIDAHMNDIIEGSRVD